MKYFYDDMNQIMTLPKGRRLFLFLDYDGTLTPIAQRPERTKLGGKTRTILRRLSQNCGCEVAIISGRSLNEIKRLVGLKNIIYVGNHGFQVEGPAAKFTVPLSMNYKKNLSRVKASLRKYLSSFEGVYLEDKDVCLAVHYRQAARKDIGSVKSIFDKVTAPLLKEKKIRVTFGKKILEIRPPIDWHKGSVIKWLLGKYRSAHRGTQVLPVYIGDDLTDEDAFKVLKKSGMTIVVGKTNRSNARYFVRDIGEVGQFLSMVLNILEKNLPADGGRKKLKGMLCPN